MSVRERVLLRALDRLIEAAERHDLDDPALLHARVIRAVLRQPGDIQIPTFTNLTYEELVGAPAVYPTPVPATGA